jgi:hypothetical protein
MKVHVILESNIKVKAKVTEFESKSPRKTWLPGCCPEQMPHIARVLPRCCQEKPGNKLATRGTEQITLKVAISPGNSFNFFQSGQLKFKLKQIQTRSQS